MRSISDLRDRSSYTLLVYLFSSLFFSLLSSILAILYFCSFCALTRDRHCLTWSCDSNLFFISSNC